MKKIVTILFIIFVSLSYADSNSFVMKSAFLPGMGQLSAGKGKLQSRNTQKGLGIMAGFIISLHQTVSSISKMNSYAEQTIYLDKKTKLTTNKNDWDIAHAEHVSAHENYESAKTSTIIFGAITGCFYIGSILDAMLFTKSDQNMESSFKTIIKKTNLSFASSNNVNSIKVGYKF